MLALSGCSSGKPVSAVHHRHSLSAIIALHHGNEILVQRGYSIGPIAASSRYVFWGAASSDESDDALLLRRELHTGANRVVAHRFFQAFGLATAANSVVYTTRSGTNAQLEAMPAAGGPAQILTRMLAAPFDARGDIVAWAESDGKHNRVLFQHLRTGRRTIAFAAPRCIGNRCYRIDRVTVARRGVVFDLGSVGQGYPSLIVRRSWSASHPSFARVPRDPQPDLARSSAGALYYQLGQGWMEWNFGRPRPTPTWPRGVRPWLLAHEDARDVVIRGADCATTVALHTRGGKTSPLPLPASKRVTTDRLGKLCRQLTGFAWSGSRLFLAWSITPQVSIEAHEQIGVAGVITASNVH